MADKTSRRSQDPQGPRFSTTYPSDVGDATLMPLLRAHHVTIDVQPPSPPWLALLITNGLPIVLMLAVLVWMGRRASRSQSGVFGFARNRARRYTEDRPRVTFADVAGADEAKQDLREVVDFLSHPAKYLAIGARIPTLGPVAFEGQDEQPFLGYQMAQGRDYSEATAARVDREVESLLAERQSGVLRLLTAARDRLDALVERLLKEETMGEAQLTRILGPRPSAEAAPQPERQSPARSSVG